MKATFLLENFLEKLSFLNHAISPRAQLPILAGFLIEAEKGKLKISATDLEIGIGAEIPASVDVEGRAVVLAKPFSELLGSLSEEKLTISKNEKTVEVSGRKTSAKLTSFEEAEFPRLFDDTGEELMKTPSEALAKDLSRIVFAASLDSSRPAFSGVLIRREKEGLLMVATDSHRLSLNRNPKLGFKKQETKPILVSGRTLRTLLSLKGSGDISMFVSEKNNQIIFSQEGTILVGRLIEAEYPEFEKIIPGDSQTKSEFNSQEMQGALRATSVFARDNANIVKMSVRKNSIRVSAKSPTLGESFVDVEAKTTGEENEIAFNLRYVLELLQNSSSDSMVFEMTGPLNPGVFKIKDDPGFIHLIMPVRVRDEELPA